MNYQAVLAEMRSLPELNKLPAEDRVVVATHLAELRALVGELCAALEPVARLSWQMSPVLTADEYRAIATAYAKGREVSG